MSRSSTNSRYGKPIVLVVDDEEAVCWALERALCREGKIVHVAPSAERALELARQEPPDAIVLDVRLPGIDGLTALERLKKLVPDAPVIVITAFGNLETAVRAVQGGAFDYLTKPFDLSQALDAVRRALDRPRAEPLESDAGTDGAYSPGHLVGRSAAIQAVFKRIALVAPHDACVLITGESGTGKELVARALHRFSRRKDGPFLPVHVASLNPNLVESELFGHVRGAFTGANQARPGLLALADGGTVFLDEIADVPLPVQVKLLRVLEQNEVFPVGGNQPQRLNVRLISATHQDLPRLVAEGRFRHDLYFRLNVFQVELPPLRQRLEDIPLLVEYFLRRLGAPLHPLPAETLRYLQSLPWVGNVRELRNAVEHAAIVARGGPLLPEYFPQLAVEPPASSLATEVRRWVEEKVRAAGDRAPSGLYEELLRCVEPALLEEVMRRVRDNRWVAGEWLGLNRATVRKKLEAYGLTRVCGEGERERSPGETED